MEKDIPLSILWLGPIELRFENLVNKYNGQLYDFKKINIVSDCERDA